MDGAILRWWCQQEPEAVCLINVECFYEADDASQERGLKHSHRNSRLFKTTNACSNANLTGVSGRGRAFKESLLLCELHLVFFAACDV